MASRRINFLQTIVKRDESELTNRVFRAQLDNTCEGDYAQLVQGDLKEIDMPFNLDDIKNTGVETFKKMIKNKIKEAAFKYLQSKLETHTKVKNLKYFKLETQKYLTSPLFSNNETSLLFGLRTRTARAFKANFSYLYGGKTECPLKCWDVKKYEPAPADNQEHSMVCNKLKTTSNNISLGMIEYNDLFSDVQKQKEVITMFTELLEYKEKMMQEKENPPGDKLDPSSCINSCCSSTLFTRCAVCNDGAIIGN